MRGGFFILLLLWLLYPGEAQEGEGDGSPYSIPQTIFVGDRGRLVIPLGSAFSGSEGRIVRGPEGLPQSEDLLITQVELERRGGMSRLLIDFRAYAPGLIKLPPIEIASHTFTGLELTISSILDADPQGKVLSGPTPPLSAPGTAVMIYGTLLGILGFFLLVVLGRIWALPRLRNLGVRFRRRRRIRAMGRILRRLRNTLLKDKSAGGPEAEILSRVSREFRTFLGLLSGMNCRAMVPREFTALPSLTGAPEDHDAVLSGEFLRDVFSRCDTLRFSGAGIRGTDVIGILDDFKSFTDALERGERESRRLAGRARIPAEGAL
ncbi:MAG: hypothetical protein LBP93_09160 [Treponema sp.]|jgi:hypothetical protein|nr:hypothetical protein [Treponema sp.]